MSEKEQKQGVQVLVWLAEISRFGPPVVFFTGRGMTHKFVWNAQLERHVLNGAPVSVEEFNRVAEDIFCTRSRNYNFAVPKVIVSDGFGDDAVLVAEAVQLRERVAELEAAAESADRVIVQAAEDIKASVKRADDLESAVKRLEGEKEQLFADNVKLAAQLSGQDSGGGGASPAPVEENPPVEEKKPKARAKVAAKAAEGESA
ncbi:hypothetical protein Ga0100231_004905 [Opitutaceae bacterium TAV4]|nr:hypothetical protein Ga0100231_004905 [Opitutaceae bacterium TAV4]RRK02335.1 hypothetical protein Ga0100230_004050 [Opitutaceae bacterium TAV3]